LTLILFTFCIWYSGSLNKPSSKHVSFPEDVNELVFIDKLPSTQNNKVQESRMTNLANDNTKGNRELRFPYSSTLNLATKPNATATGEDLHRRLVGVLSQCQAQGSNKISLQTLNNNTTTVPQISKLQTFSVQHLSDEKSIPMKRNLSKDESPVNASLKQELKTKLEDDTVSNSNYMSGYESENSEDSCQTEPFSLKSASEEDFESNENNNNTFTVHFDENSSDSNLSLDRTMIERAWDSIFGNAPPRTDIPVEYCNTKAMKEASDFSILKAIKNLNLSY